MTPNHFFDTISNLSGKPNDLKQYNQRLVISLLQNCDSTAAAQLSYSTGLSKTTISKILSELVKRNLVQSVGKGDSTTGNGKKPEFFSLNATYALAVVFSLFNSRNLRCSIVDLCGNIQYEKDYNLPNDAAYTVLLETMADAFNHVWKNLELGKSLICGISIGYNGIANTDCGEILYPANSSDAHFHPLCSDLAERIPSNSMIYVDNIGHFSGYAELLFEESRDISKIAVISCGEVINGSILSSSQQHPGNRGIVGEFGHLIFNPNASTTCYCGSNGCLESLISERALISYSKKISWDYPFSKLAQRVQTETVGIEEILSAIAENDIFAKAVFKPVLDYLTILIRNLAVLESVSKIIIQGPYVQAGSDFLKTLQSNAENCCRYSREANLTIEFSKWSLQGSDADKRACVYGAARYTSNFYLDNLVAKWFST